jgi:flagellar biosynthetic protein FlhB
MAEDTEKTEEPTPKKIEQAREEGNVGKSAEIVGAAVLFFGSLYLLFFSSWTFNEIKKMMIYTYSFIGKDNDSSTFLNIAYTVSVSAFTSVLPIFVVVIVIALASNWTQFGFLSNPIKIDFQRLDPIKGLANLFSFKKLLEAFKLTVKLGVIFVVMVLLIVFTANDLLSMMNKDLDFSLQSIVELIVIYLSSILLIIIIFAIIDFYFTHFYYMESLKMSVQEIKDEFKSMEGDPKVKSRIRQIQFSMSRKRMMSEVPSADVVITNPTHYAVALRYDNTKDSAPKVVAKGVDFLALKIREIAVEHDIPIVENPPLARALFEQVELEQTIPSDFYKAIAEIFTYIYQLKGKI